MNARRLRAQLWLIAAAFFALCSHAQDRQPEYQLGAGDTIRVTVFQNPDLTVETRVTENGTISYPLVGSVRVGGLTIPVAEQAIAKALKDGNFIQEPQVNISLLQNRGNQVSVLGMVNRPGRFPLETANTRLSEMLAIAGGIAPTGADIVILTGIRDGKPLRREIDIPGMFLDDQLQHDIVVVGGDVIYVHRQPMYYIYGEVQRPGSFRVERGMTIRQALAQAGGLSVRGTERSMAVYRRDSAGRIEASGLDLNDPVRPDDVLYVQRSLF
jgi:polysaccharide export outer membrane protein